MRISSSRAGKSDKALFREPQAMERGWKITDSYINQILVLNNPRASGFNQLTS